MRFASVKCNRLCATARISRWQNVEGGSVNAWQDLEPTLSQMLAEIDSPGKVLVADEKPTVDLHQGDVWNQPYFPTKRKWDVGSRKIAICYQFDGRYNGLLNNPPREDIDRAFSL